LQNEALQFDQVVPSPGVEADSNAHSGSDPQKPGVTCETCHTAIETEYYHVNSRSVCSRCRATIESYAEPPRGLGPFTMALVFGLGAGIVGAVIYYAVIAITNFEIGIVAILIGYMVGYAVRKGARGRGGRRFQVLAVALTY
jgi:hypothetical protein